MSDQPLVRSMPSNEEAEQALIGALLNDNEKMDQVADFFVAKYLFNPLHVKIYELISKFVDKGVTASPLNLKKFLEDEEIFKISEINAYDYLIKLAVNSHVIINIRDIAMMLYEVAVRRELIKIGEEAVNNAFKEEVDVSVNDRIEKIEQDLFNVAMGGGRSYDFLPIKNSVTHAIERLEYISKNRGTTDGIPTNFRHLDLILGGMQPSDLLIVAARPSMGKTSFAIKLGLNAADFFLSEENKNNDENTNVSTNANGKAKSVAILSLEMSSDQIVNRILSIKSGIEGRKIRTGVFGKDELKKVIYEAGNIKTLPIFVDDTPALSISAIRTRARRMKRQHNLGLLVVDYLQLIRSSATSQSKNKVEQIGEVSQGLKEIAKELNIPVVALSQLSRAVELRVDKRPQLSDLRDSGNIEQDADVVMFLYREEYYLDRKIPVDSQENMDWQQKLNSVKDMAEIIVAKQRNGPTDSCFLRFEKETTNFYDGAEGLSGRLCK